MPENIEKNKGTWFKNSDIIFSPPIFFQDNMDGVRKIGQKGVRGLLASDKELFTPKTNGISTRQDEATWSL